MYKWPIWVSQVGVPNPENMVFLKYINWIIQGVQSSLPSVWGISYVQNVCFDMNWRNTIPLLGRVQRLDH